VAVDGCATVEPALVTVSPGHVAACHLLDGRAP